MTDSPFSSWPSFTADDAAAVSQVLLSGKVNYWTGTQCREFEREFASWVGCSHAVALMNGTVALDLALRALKIGPGDEVVVTPRSFIASVSCVVNAGAVPVFADVDIDSGTLTAAGIAAVLSPRTKAVICVHLAGWPCDMGPIMDLAEHAGLFVIEDCAQAHGARYRGRPVGSIGHIGAWSFCQDKIMTTGGEGGMVTCNDELLWRAMWAYKDHGKSHESKQNLIRPSGFRWMHDGFGTNWRMTEMQAVIGRIQLQRISDWTKARTVNALSIREALKPFAGENGVVRIPLPRCVGCAPRCSSRVLGSPSWTANGDMVECQHAYYRYYAYVRPENLADGWTRDRIVEEINARGVPCFVGSCSEIYLEKAFDGTGYRPANRLPVAKELGETALMFLVHPTLTDAEIHKSQHVVAEVFSAAAAP